ncbi:MAG TPA: C40 family peptidase [Gaiellaceae bacterium]
MLRLRLLFLLLFLTFAFGSVLVRPLRAEAETTPANGPNPPTDQVPPVPGLTELPGEAGTAGLLRRPAAAAHKLAHGFHLPLGQRVVSYARHLLGVRYEYGGATPRTGFDCSGFVRYVYGHFGVSLDHSSFADFVRGRRVGRWQMKPGDLVFFDGAGHVGIYVGHDRFIHAPHSGTVVRISTLKGWYSERFDGARRID